MNEEWLPIKGYEGLYEVSSLGRVKSLNYRKSGACKIFTGSHDKDGYLRTALRNPFRKDVRIHRLVAEAFIPNPDNLPLVNHIDEDKSNNHVSNLEWCTPQYNNDYSISRRVVAKDSSGRVVHMFKSTAEAGRLGFTQCGVSAACTGRIKRHRGLFWEYA